jgi:NTE family protein
MTREEMPIHRDAAEMSVPGNEARQKIAKHGQIVLVLQGGGALGAYQAGVYEALHEAGIEPDWVIGTSIGAIHAAIIAGNEPSRRLDQIKTFWKRVSHDPFYESMADLPWFGRNLPQMMTMMNGITNFCTPNFSAFMNAKARLATESAALYSTEPLRTTLSGLIDFSLIGKQSPRLTVGAANLRSSEMHYFDSRSVKLDVRHIMASGALPPAFPAIKIDDDYYWDGGVLSNTPCEVIFDDNPRRSSVVFSVDIWNPQGPDPATIGDVVNRQQEVQFSSRLVSHIRRQKQIHRLRHIISDLSARLPEEERKSDAIRPLAGYGCVTYMHFVQLVAPRIDGEDHMKGIDFSTAGIRARWDAGLNDTRKVLQKSPWEGEFDPLEGLYLHEWQAS